MHVTVHITAGKQLKEKFAARMRELKIGVAGVFAAAAVRYQGRAIALAPHDTGALRAGIKVTRASYRKSSTDRRFGTIRAKVRTTAAYSRYVEFGTARRGAGTTTSNTTSRRSGRVEGKGGWRAAFMDEGAPVFQKGSKATYVRRLPPIVHGQGLAAWAERKGINRWALQRSIGKTGGAKPRPFWYPIALDVPAELGPEILAVAQGAFS